MATVKKQYETKHTAPSGLVVKVVDITGTTLVLTPDPDFIGVAAVLPPPAPENVVDPNPLQCSLIAYVGQFVGPTTINIPGTEWSQAYIVYLPNGLATTDMLSAISAAIAGGSSPPPGDGTGHA